MSRTRTDYKTFQRQLRGVATRMSDVPGFEREAQLMHTHVDRLGKILKGEDNGNLIEELNTVKELCAQIEWIILRVRGRRGGPEALRRRTRKASV